MFSQPPASANQRHFLAPLRAGRAAHPRVLAILALGSLLAAGFAGAQTADDQSGNPSPYATNPNPNANQYQTSPNTNSYGATYNRPTPPTGPYNSNNSNYSNYSNNCNGNSYGNLSSYSSGSSFGNCSSNSIADRRPHQELEFAVDASAGYDSNPGLVAGQNAGDATVYTGASLFLLENLPRLKALVGATGGYTDFLGGSRAGYALGAVDARAEYAIIPERFYWTASEVFGQNATSAVAAPTASNLTNTNMFSTGPQFVIPVGDNRINLGAGEGIARYAGESTQNNDRLNLNAGFTHPIDRFQSISLDGTYQRITYVDQILNPYSIGSNYSIENIFVQWFEGTVRNDMVVDVGDGRVVQGARVFKSPTLHLNLNRATAPHWNLGLVAESEYSDTAQQFTNALITNRNPVINGIPTPGQIAAEQLTAQPIQTDQLRLTAKYTAPRTVFTGGIYAIKEDYLDDPRFNTTNYGISGRYSRRLSFNTDLSVSAGYQRVSYPGSTLVEQTEDIGPMFSWHVVDNFIVSASINYERRTASNVGYGYNDYRGFINFRWSPFDNRGTFDESPTAFGGVGGGGMQNIFSVPGARY
jgi:hypothetical protein